MGLLFMKDEWIILNGRLFYQFGFKGKELAVTINYLDGLTWIDKNEEMEMGPINYLVGYESL